MGTIFESIYIKVAIKKEKKKTLVWFKTCGKFL